MAARLGVRPCSCWVSRLLKRFDSIMVRILDVRSYGRRGGVRQLFELVAPLDLVEAVAREIRADPTLRDVRLVLLKGGRIYGSAKVLQSLPCSLVEGSGCFLRAVINDSGGEVEWHLIGKAHSLRFLMRRLEREGLKIRVKRLTKIKGKGALTGRQEMVIRAALELGYFDYPKRVGIEGLARALGITPATATETLRKGLKKILSEYYAGDQASQHLSSLATSRGRSKGSP